MSNEDGGQAFPKTDSFRGPGGMSLRDWFAGLALQGLAGNSTVNMEPEDTAKWAFVHADAMLEARKK